jgi:periplasmic protein TonB
MKKTLLLILGVGFTMLSNAQTENKKEVSKSKPSTTKKAEKTVKMDDEELFQKVEIESEFPGNQDSWRNFLSKNLNADVPSKNGAKAGVYKVTVRFVVNKDGSLSDFVLENNPGFGTGEEVIRLLKTSPKWKPGLQNKVAVNSIKRLPITFVVSEE